MKIKNKIKTGEAMMVFALYIGIAMASAGAYQEIWLLLALGVVMVCLSLLYYLSTKDNRDNHINNTPFNGNQLRKSEPINRSVNGTERNEIYHNGYGVCNKTNYQG